MKLGSGSIAAKKASGFGGYVDPRVMGRGKLAAHSLRNGSVPTPDLQNPHWIDDARYGTREVIEVDEPLPIGLGHEMLIGAEAMANGGADPHFSEDLLEKGAPASPAAR